MVFFYCCLPGRESNPGCRDRIPAWTHLTTLTWVLIIFLFMNLNIFQLFLRPWTKTFQTYSLEIGEALQMILCQNTPPRLTILKWGSTLSLRLVLIIYIHTVSFKFILKNWVASIGLDGILGANFRISWLLDVQNFLHYPGLSHLVWLAIQGFPCRADPDPIFESNETQLKTAGNSFRTWP